MTCPSWVALLSMAHNFIELDKAVVHVIRLVITLDRNDVDLTEPEDIKKRWQEYTEELYRRDLNDSDNQDGVITCPESDILECEVKWA